jgi:hypothetical protein
MGDEVIEVCADLPLDEDAEAVLVAAAGDDLLLLFRLCHHWKLAQDALAHRFEDDWRA